MIQKLTNYASIIGVIGAIGGGFYAWGEFNTRLDAIENKEFVVNETVDLTPINQKISDLEVEILDRMSALEDEWMARDNDTNDVILDDIAGVLKLLPVAIDNTQSPLSAKDPGMVGKIAGLTLKINNMLSKKVKTI